MISPTAAGGTVPTMPELLPTVVVIALLRVLRDKPLTADDDEALFDEFETTVLETTLVRAARRVLGETPWHVTRRNKALDAALVDMLREHARARGVAGVTRGSSTTQGRDRDADRQARQERRENRRLPLAWSRDTDAGDAGADHHVRRR